MSDRWAFIAAVFAAGGAWMALPIPWVFVLLFIIAVALTRSPAVLAVAIFFLSTALAESAWTALDEPRPVTASGIAVLITDPEDRHHVMFAEARMGSRHVRLVARGKEAMHLGGFLAGHVLYITGEVKGLSGRAAPALRRRHIAHVVNVESMSRVSDGDLLARIGNGARSVLQRGASNSMPADQASLFSGLVYGDDRQQRDETRDAFRESGLAHLTAVSGANVAFVLLLVAPVLQRFSLLGRFVGGCTVLLLFGTITRWEPSVVRAEIMAALVLFAALAGRPTAMFRTLCICVVIALLIDPFLIGSVGFLLSISACLGMALLGERISLRVPGPSSFRRAVGYSCAAQLFVMPIAIVVFGSFSFVGVMTNLLVEPAVAVVMTWGLGAGVVAGFAGDGIADLIHMPTRLMLAWIGLVAETGADINSNTRWRWLGVLGPSALLFVMRRQRVSVDTRERHIPPARLSRQR